MTYHDAQGNEIEDSEWEEMKAERCWLCGHKTIYESGLCWPDYAWAERLELDRGDDAEPLTEMQIREAYRAKEAAKFQRHAFD